MWKFENMTAILYKNEEIITKKPGFWVDVFQNIFALGNEFYPDSFMPMVNASI